MRIERRRDEHAEHRAVEMDLAVRGAGHPVEAEALEHEEAHPDEDEAAGELDVRLWVFGGGHGGEEISLGRLGGKCWVKRNRRPRCADGGAIG